MRLTLQTSPLTDMSVDQSSSLGGNRTLYKNVYREGEEKRTSGVVILYRQEGEERRVKKEKRMKERRMKKRKKRGEENDSS